MKKLMSIKNLQKYFPVKKNNFFQIGTEYVKANKDISVDIYEGETLGIVGESGCGKSTFGRTIIQLQRQTGGSTLYYGDTIEDFMPDYVQTVYRNLPKISGDYDQDLNTIEKMEEELETLDAAEKEAHFETLRLKKIEFDNTYGNTLRLVGGLVAHDNLKQVSSILLNRYDAASTLAEYKRNLEFEQQKQKMKAAYNQEEIDRLTEELQTAEKNLNEENAKVEELKAPLRGMTKFERFERYLDEGIDLAALTKKETRLLRKDLQIIFQDPYSSLDPRLTVGDIIGEGLLIHKFFKSKRDPGYQAYIVDIMEKCGLKAEFIHRYPHQFSGGQRQRIGIARALAVQPKFIVCDEAVSALDVSIQSQIINLLLDLREKNNLTYLFITHDLGVVRYISDRIGVMYFGHLVELGSAQEIFNNPKHPYTKQLLNAIPTMEEDEDALWDVEEEYDDFEFHYSKDGDHDPDWIEVAEDHFVATTLKDREAYYDKRKESSHEFVTS
ncbi:peptide/nickel transport system ATP-binding protein [Atopostipes suicloacalis DSM 15692]|uniref:Peptide/nickel transport system ATP-binding protein n=1 Tax=Atopostipes suicloacalis DSM 15692 TaxID=1121025 RepID=A0A1M4VP09_9LACT|nr:oligopeptide/dipeptide ABC transporter ATP-binding protein [Atopostipes suicloacalis]SHE70573.1 peptide/nickel transport system ATP-binding protein [Atopostipes suicloacalis DSM 15692]